jgi:hypothetical protein
MAGITAAGIAWINSTGNLAGCFSPIIVGSIRQTLNDLCYVFAGRQPDLHGLAGDPADARGASVTGFTLRCVNAMASRNVFRRPRTGA